MGARLVTPRTWVLEGSTDSGDTDRKLVLLSALFNNAREKHSEIVKARQTNLNLALIIFAGLSSFSIKFVEGWYSLWTAVALFVAMCAFAGLDRKYHRYVHGWRESEKQLVNNMVSVINDPSCDTPFVRFAEEGERKAEVWGLQQVVTYLLVTGALIHLVYCIIRTLRP